MGIGHNNLNIRRFIIFISRAIDLKWVFLVDQTTTITWVEIIILLFEWRTNRRKTELQLETVGSDKIISKTGSIVSRWYKGQTLLDSFHQGWHDK